MADPHQKAEPGSGPGDTKEARRRFLRWWTAIACGGIVAVSAVYLVVFAVKPRSGEVALSAVLLVAVGMQVLLVIPLVRFSRVLGERAWVTVLRAVLVPCAVLVPVAVAAQNVLPLIGLLGFIPPMRLVFRSRGVLSRRSEAEDESNQSLRETRPFGRIAITASVVASILGTAAALALTAGFFKPVLRFGCLESPLWSPDGAMIAYREDCYAGYGEYFRVVDDYPQMRVTTSDGHSQFDMPGYAVGEYGAWSPTGATFGYSRYVKTYSGYTSPYEWVEFEVRPDGGTNQVEGCNLDVNYYTTVRWAPNGRLVALDEFRGYENVINVVDVAGCARVAVTPRIQDTTWRHPSWSPDSKYLAIARTDSRQAWPGTGVWVASADSSSFESVAGQEIGPAVWPDWSPDGSTIAFVSVGANGGGLWFVRPDGSELRKIASLDSERWWPEEPGRGTGWSPDGRSFAYVDCKGRPGAAGDGAAGAELHVVRTDTLKDAVLWVSSTCLTELDWSPDGTVIAVTGESRSDPGLFLIPAEGGGARRIADGPARWFLNGERTDF